MKSRLLKIIQFCLMFGSFEQANIKYESRIYFSNDRESLGKVLGVRSTPEKSLAVTSTFSLDGNELAVGRIDDPGHGVRFSVLWQAARFRTAIHRLRRHGLEPIDQ